MDKLDKQIMETKIKRVECIIDELMFYMLKYFDGQENLYIATSQIVKGIAEYKRMINKPE